MPRESRKGRARSPARVFAPGEILLLRAALLEGQEAVRAWEAWRSLARTPELPPSLLGLRPLLYRNLSQMGVCQDPWLQEMAATQRQTWYRNQLLLEEAGTLLRLFAEGHIETLLLKGVALILRHYPDPGLRPMADLDLLVRGESAAAAFELLEQEGWTCARRPDALGWVEAHGVPFTRGASRPLDLHWRLFEDCSWRGADDDFWAQSVPVDVGGAPTRILYPTDQLVHVVVSGVRWSANAAIRWVADAVAVLRSSATRIDWPRLVDRAASHRLSLPLGAGLAELRAVLELPVPEDVLRDLERLPTSRLERWEFRARGRPPHRRGPLLACVLHLTRRARLVRDGGLDPGLGGLIQAMAREWGVRPGWPLLVEALPRGLRRLWAGVRPF